MQICKFVCTPDRGRPKPVSRVGSEKRGGSTEVSAAVHNLLTARRWRQIALLLQSKRIATYSLRMSLSYSSTDSGPERYEGRRFSFKKMIFDKKEVTRDSPKSWSWWVAVKRACAPGIEVTTAKLGAANTATWIARTNRHCLCATDQCSSLVHLLWVWSSSLFGFCPWQPSPPPLLGWWIVADLSAKDKTVGCTSASHRMSLLKTDAHWSCLHDIPESSTALRARQKAMQGICSEKCSVKREYTPIKLIFESLQCSAAYMLRKRGKVIPTKHRTIIKNASPRRHRCRAPDRSSTK